MVVGNKTFICRRDTDGRLRFTDEQIKQARSINIVELARRYGYELEDKESRAYRAKNIGGGLYFFKDSNIYHHFGMEKTGSTIDFVMMVEKISFVDAVKKLLGESSISVTTHSRPYIPKERTPLVMPEKANNYKRVYWYLTQVRGIEPDIVSGLMRERKIYQQQNFGNCVFVGYDETGKARYCSMRGTYPDNPYKSDKNGSDKSYPFHITGRGGKVIVCEAPIDCMSHASLTKLYGQDWTLDHRISLGCLSNKALDRFLGWFEIREIVFALDNDVDGVKPDGTPCNWGQQATIKYMYKYKERGYSTKIQKPYGNDFNNDLMQFRSNMIKRLEVSEDNENDAEI